MSFIDKFLPFRVGQRTQITGWVLLAWQIAQTILPLFGVSIPEGLHASINGALGGTGLLFAAAKVDRRIG